MKTERPKPKACCTVATEACCPARPALHQRPLLTLVQAGGLAGLFKVLANDTRLRLLHALARAEELCVSELSEALGMKPQAVSNQLQRLLDQEILVCRRDGNTIHYRVAEPCVTVLLDRGLCLMEEARSPSATRPTQQE
jgi:DNA-binding transcriptional ArsR family regulator